MKKVFFFKQPLNIIVTYFSVILNPPTLFQYLVQTFQRIPFSFYKIFASATCCKKEKNRYVIDNVREESFKQQPGRHILI